VIGWDASYRAVMLTAGKHLAVTALNSLPFQRAIDEISHYIQRHGHEPRRPVDREDDQADSKFQNTDDLGAAKRRRRHALVGRHAVSLSDYWRFVLTDNSSCWYTALQILHMALERFAVEGSVKRGVRPLLAL
jgi:hypothetical protein